MNKKPSGKQDHQNPKVKNRDRQKQAPAALQTDPDQEFVFGRHAVLALLDSKRAINKLFVQASLMVGGGDHLDSGKVGASLAAILAKAKANKVQWQAVPKQKLDTLSQHAPHQGVVAATAAFPYAELDDIFASAAKQQQSPFILILDSIEDPHNFGSILRTADAAGVHGVIIPRRHAVGLTAVVAKTSTGAIERIPVVRETNLVQTVKALKAKGVWVYATAMAGTDYRKWDTDRPLAIIIGNEGKGVSRLLKETADEIITIPIAGKVQSLNASVAAGLLMYEVYRGRNKLV